jgi:hypothetical protein
MLLLWTGPCAWSYGCETEDDMRLYRAVVNRAGSKDDRGTVGGSRAFRVARRRGRKREHESPAVSISIIGQLLGTIVKEHRQCDRAINETLHMRCDTIRTHKSSHILDFGASLQWGKICSVNAEDVQPPVSEGPSTARPQDCNESHLSASASFDGGSTTRAAACCMHSLSWLGRGCNTT